MLGHRRALLPTGRKPFPLHPSALATAALWLNAAPSRAPPQKPTTTQALSRAHIESVALDAALEGARRCMDPDCRRSLKALADLFALDCIYNDIVFRNDDYIAPEKVRGCVWVSVCLRGEAGGQALLWERSPRSYVLVISWPVSAGGARCRPSITAETLTAAPATRPWSTPQAKAIQRLIEQLCGELRGVAVPLVDAFAIPDHILRAPIGLASAAVDPYGEYLHAAGFD